MSGAAVRYGFILSYSFLLIFAGSNVWAADPVIPAGSAMLGQPLPQTCDPSVMQSIESQSWMQGQQDLEVAQSLISKPDSVLEYTCFDQMASVTAVRGGGIFSDADQTIETSGTLGEEFLEALGEEALDRVVTKMMPAETMQLVNAMGGMDSLSMMMKMSPTDRNAWLASLPEETQNQMRDKIVSGASTELRAELGANPETRSLMQIMNTVQSIPGSRIDTILPPMSNPALENMLRHMPPSAMSELRAQLPNVPGLPEGFRVPGINLRGGGGFGPVPQELEDAVQGAVLSSLNSYASQNFSGGFLGGRMPEGYQPSPSVGRGDYNCGRMNMVWEMAGCADVRTDAGGSAFKTLSDYAAGDDIRGAACGKNPDWEGMYSNADQSLEDQPAFLQGGDCAKSTLIKSSRRNPQTRKMEDTYTCATPGCVYRGGRCYAD